MKSGSSSSDSESSNGIWLKEPGLFGNQPGGESQSPGVLKFGFLPVVLGVTAESGLPCSGVPEPNFLLLFLLTFFFLTFFFLTFFFFLLAAFLHWAFNIFSDL